MPLQPLTTTTQTNFLVPRTKQQTTTKKWLDAVLPHLQETLHPLVALPTLLAPLLYQPNQPSLQVLLSMT
jgi:hypothetical protein